MKLLGLNDKQHLSNYLAMTGNNHHFHDGFFRSEVFTEEAV
jgi:hypothetical protein